MASDPNVLAPSPVRECLFKILVVGDVGTGKTSLIKRYVHNIFSMNYKATIGVDFALKVVNWDPTTVVRLQLWDIAGQERYGNMTRVYYKEAVGAIVVYDVTRPSTLEGAIKWKEDIDAKVSRVGEETVPVLLVGNKCDLKKEGATSEEELDRLAAQHSFCGWFETSAKENLNVDRAVRFLVGKVLEAEQKRSSPPPGERDDLVRPDLLPSSKPQHAQCPC